MSIECRTIDHGFVGNILDSHLIVAFMLYESDKSLHDMFIRALNPQINFFHFCELPLNLNDIFTVPVAYPTHHMNLFVEISIDCS